MSQKQIIGILLADPARAQQLTGQFDHDKYEPRLVQSVDDLHRLVTSERIDVVIIDNDIPGFLSGIEVLERLHKTLPLPRAVLIAVSNASLEERVKSLQMAVLVQLSEPIGAIAKAAIAPVNITQINSENAAPVFIHAKARELVHRADFIRPLPQLVTKYAGQLNQSTCSIADLARDIEFDPKMTGALLKLMNSAAMGLRNKVARVFDAVNLLGIRKTVSLILSTDMAQTQTRIATSLPSAFRPWYHNRSVLIAGAASAFAQRTGGASPDTAYVLGLLQELGILILGHAFGEKYATLVGRVREMGPLRLEAAEHQEYGVTHADVSGALLQKWELPQSLVRLVAYHHRPDSEASLPDAERKLLQFMHVGEAFANLTDTKVPQRYQLLNQMLEQIGITTAEQTKACLAEAVTKALQCGQLLSLPISDERAFRRLVA